MGQNFPNVYILWEGCEKPVYSCKKEAVRGRTHIGIYTLQIGSFSPNTATKFHGRRQPCRGILSCLVKKSLVLECFAVLNRRFFFTAATGDRVNTGCIPRETGAVVEEKIHSKPCKSLCEAAQSFFFNIGYDYSDRLLSISTNLSASSSPVPRAKLVTQAS